MRSFASLARRPLAAAPLSRRHAAAAAWLLAANLAVLPWAHGAEALKAVDVPTARLAALGITLVAPGDAAAGSHAFPAMVAANPADALVLAAPAGGLVSAVRVELNQRVKAGQPLVELQAPELAEGAAALLEARADAAVADDALGRERQLQAEGVIPAARVRRAEAAALQAHARMDARRAQLRLLGLGPAQIDALRGGAPLPVRVTLASPGAGTVVELPVGTGSRVEANALLARIARLDRLVLELRVPAAQARLLAEGLPVLDAQGRRIATLGPGAGEVGDGQTLRVRARLLQPQDWLPGQAVEAHLASRATGWRVPRASVLPTEGGGQAVFVRQGERFVPVPVRRLDDDGDHVVVSGALTAQSRVAAGNVVALKGAALGIGQEAR